MINGIAMIPSLLLSIYSNEDMCTKAFFLSFVCSFFVGFFAFKPMSPSSHTPTTRDGFLIVISTWVVCSVFGSLPFMLSGYAPSYIDALFESVAGYTTTGATVTSEMTMPDSLLLWKAVTHWLGGLGILFFVITVLPSFGINSQKISMAEMPGLSLVKVAPRIQDLTKLLYIMYFTLTITEFILLSFSDMGMFEALINTLGSVSTSGLLLDSAGISHYDSLYVEIVVSVYSVLAAANFVIYFYILRRDFRELKKAVEFKIFLCILAVAVIATTLGLYLSEFYDTFGESLRHGFFQTVSFLTTTGYATDEFYLWPPFCTTLFMVLLFIGGCTCSTSGTIKVIRVVVVFKLILRGFYLRLHPRALKAVKVGGEVVSAHMAASISAFVILYFVMFLISCLVFSIQDMSLETAFWTSASLMSNTGIGACPEIASGDYAFLSEGLKLYACFMMISGRLELLTVIVMLFPSFWNPNRGTTKS